MVILVKIVIKIFKQLKKVNGCTIDIQIPLTDKAKEESQTTDFANVVETMIDEDDPKNFNVVMMIISILLKKI